jgi:transcriptional regulator with XRE-family HTH domain
MDYTYMKELGRQIADLRRKRKMTQTELAERAGVTWSFIAKVEGGDRLPSMATLERLAKALRAGVRIQLVGK